MKRSKREQQKRLKKIEKDSENYFTYIFEKVGFTRLRYNILSWAEKNRKKMFFITFSFLIFVVVFTFISPFSHEEIKSATEVEFQNLKNISFEKKENLSLDEVEFLMKAQNEIERLSRQKNISKEDSIKINNLYEQLKKSQNGKN